MPVDIAFELSYLLSDKLGRSVEILDVSFDPGSARLCVKASVDGETREACIEVKPCKGVEEPRWVRCVSKNLVNNEKLLEELAKGLKGGG